ncbi:replicative DNA helicase [Orbus sturtevantii]|uniref:replicative DNA helicase n=1 Tax=Orbus sturtevantii TaxID=3074109 RepID=UPI00370D6716
MANLFYSIEVEQSVLGSLLINNDQIDNAADLAIDDFQKPQHKIIFNAIKLLIDQGKSADIVTVSESLTDVQLTQCGGLAYIAELSKNTPSTLNFKHYFSILRNYTKARKLQTIMSKFNDDMTKTVFTDSQSCNELIANIESELFKLGNTYQQKNTLSVTQLLDNVMEFLESENSPFISTGFTDLDRKIGGLEPKEITLVGARPSMGKTAWLISLICYYIIRASSHPDEPIAPIVIFSLEMDAQSLMMRIISILSGVPFIDIKNKHLDDSDYGKLSSAIALLLKFKTSLIIDDEAHLTPSILRRKLQRYIRLHGHPQFVGIDYVQLMSLGAKQIENRAVEVSTISRELKIQCKDFSIPLVLLAQLNRSVENRPDKRPLMSDLKESGALEQDATSVILLYRDEVYNEHTEFKGMGEFIIAKARNASVGSVKVQFNGPCMHYRNLAKGEN